MEPIKTDVVVIGAGPGGYAAAFYAADKGKSVVLIEQDASLGGVCLNRGCIPSKALLYASGMIHEAKVSEERGISFGSPKIELEKLRTWKSGIIEKLAKGVSQLAKARKITVLHGKALFEDSKTLRVELKDGQRFLHFENAIIATGSSPALPSLFDLGNKRVMTSTEALDVPEIPKSLLVVGGGYIGMELGTVYAGLGSEVTLAEASDTILAGADPDLARPVLSYAKSHFKEVRFGSKISNLATKGKKIEVTMTYEGKKHVEQFDRVLVSVGRSPNSVDIGLDNTKIKLKERGFIDVNDKMQTSEPNIYAIGDIVGGALLAHKAHKEARIAIDNICGEPHSFEKSVQIPAVVFTKPEVAWVGLTETEAKAQNIAVKVSKFPWSASGRALSFDHPEGLTKVIVEPDTERVLGMGIVGYGAGELIAEGTLAIEMGATVTDLAETVHPHPTLSETIMEAADAFFGHATHTVSKDQSK